MKQETKEAETEPLEAHVLIVEARFYDDLLDELGAGAREALERAGATYETTVVPGALEVPAAIAIAQESGRFDGFIGLGVVIRGETTHYDIVACESARGIMDLTLEGLAIGNGILTVENLGQAWARARRNEMNKGGGAAEAALAMIRLKRHFLDG